MILGTNAASLFDIDPRKAFVGTSADNLSRLKPEKGERNHLNTALGYVVP
jgi:hypothetical protein